MIQRHPLDALSALIFLATFGVAAVLGYRRPAWGVALLIALDPFALYRDVWRTTVTLPKVALLGLAVALLLRRISPRALWSPPARPLFIGAAAIVAATALSAIPGIYVDAVLRETLKATEYLLLFVCCVVATAADDDPAPVRLALLATVSLVALVALAQEFGGAPSAAQIGGHVVARIAGPLEGPNQLAGYLGLAIPLLIALGLGERVRSAYVVALIAVVALALTLSRSGLASTLVAVALVVVVIRSASPRTARLVAGAAGLLGVAVLALAGGLARFASVHEVGTPSGLATRAQLWAAAITLWKTSPLLGIGAGNYELELPRAGLEGVRTHANSWYLQALTEGGIPLLASVLWTTVAAGGIASFARSRDPFVLGVAAASFGFCLHQIVDDLTFYPKAGGFWWILLGIAVGRLVVRRTEGRTLGAE